MAESYNLTPAGELPVTEAEEVDVLCVENGELKRKAGAKLGGGGGYVIHVPESDVESNEEDNISVILTESYDNFASILFNGGSVWLSLVELGEPLVAIVTMWGYYDGALILVSLTPFVTIQVACPNGTIAPPTV